MGLMVYIRYKDQCMASNMCSRFCAAELHPALQKHDLCIHLILPNLPCTAAQYTSRAAQLYRAMLEREMSKLTPQAAVAALHW
eukprot:1161994-Pelagomonas_calceolata.AAC.2